MTNITQDIAILLEEFISTNILCKVEFNDETQDEVLFKDVYLYKQGLQVKYFSKKHDDLKTILWEDIKTIDDKSIEDLLAEKKEVSQGIATSPSNFLSFDGLGMSSVPLGGPKNKVLLSIGKLTRLIKNELEQEKFKNVWVCGEISNFTLAASGHAYFSLKDEQATIQAVMFRSSISHVKFSIKNGLKIEALGEVSVYARRGNYQLLIKRITPEGIGELQLAFEQLKEKLASEGFFDPEHKKAIPKFPEKVGIITSPTGAAIKDIIKTTATQFPTVELIVYPSLVQGDEAAINLVRMIELANIHEKCDVLIIGRGGGSVEDLWPFNEEIVARAIFASNIPIISAVGHEIDFTIADFVADYRAATPTAAAEYISQHKKELSHILALQEKKIAFELQQRLKKISSLVERSREDKLIDYISFKSREVQQRVDELDKDTLTLIKDRYKQSEHNFFNVTTKLDALSPFKVLKRGYSVVYDDKKEVANNVDKLKIGDSISIQFHKGEIKAQVKSKNLKRLG